MQFVQDHHAALRRIANATYGSSTLEDVQNEIWITADQLSSKLGYEIDFNDQQHQNLILAWTYQRMVRYCEQVLRYASHLGPTDSTEDWPDLSEMLTHGTDEDPATILGVLEADPVPSKEPEGHVSTGAAWLMLLRMCDNRMTMVAHFLKISVSHSYRCYSRVVHVSRTQGHLPLMVAENAEFTPRPWRRFWIYREPEQLVFDFDEKLELR